MATLIQNKANRNPAFYNGYRAFLNNRHWDNPYKPKTIMHKEFAHGADIAYLDYKYGRYLRDIPG